eukprot:Amastigsp_a339259_1001.p2 type:complete len:138 gc:universal Amastigsp_a339259_1001:486-73(-)
MLGELGDVRRLSATEALRGSNQAQRRQEARKKCGPRETCVLRGRAPRRRSPGARRPGDHSSKPSMVALTKRAKSKKELTDVRSIFKSAASNRTIRFEPSTERALLICAERSSLSTAREPSAMCAWRSLANAMLSSTV